MMTMPFHDEAVSEMAKEKQVARKRVQAAILAILALADGYRRRDGTFAFADYPELDDEVNKILIELSDGLLKDAEERARRILEMLEEGDYSDELIESAESGENGMVWALDMHSSNLKSLLEAWIAIMFARSLTVNETLSRVLVYMDSPNSSPMWRDAVRQKLVDPNEVRFGKGYQRKIIDAYAVLLQTFIYTTFLLGAVRKGREDGAIGYRTFRQSNYDCPLCDSLTERVWPIDTMVLPAHPRCVCGIELVYEV